jgi:hypothetical protein
MTAARRVSAARNECVYRYTGIYPSFDFQAVAEHRPISVIPNPCDPVHAIPSGSVRRAANQKHHQQHEWSNRHSHSFDSAKPEHTNDPLDSMFIGRDFTPCGFSAITAHEVYEARQGIYADSKTSR